MRFSTYIPEAEVTGGLIWLSGLTCNEENFITKAGAFNALAKRGLVIICPDTSPRGLDLPDEHTNWDFGSGAGFCVNAVTLGYCESYKMYDYIQMEIYKLLQEQFLRKEQPISIFGHSMGGHGALTMALREPSKFTSVSAFSPIVNPIQSSFGEKAFTGYLGEDKKLWQSYDSCELIAQGRIHPHPILIDQGTADEFLEKELLVDHFDQACKSSQQELLLNYRTGFDHSYYFISTFIENHIEFHYQAQRKS